MLPQTLSYTRTAIASIGINTSVASLCSKSSSRSLLPFIYGVSIIRKPAQEQYRKATHMSIRPSSTSNRLSPVATLISRPVTPSRNLATSATPSTSTSTSTHKQQSSSSQPLTWNTYLSLRQKRRYYNLTSSIVTGLGTFTGGVSFLMTQDLEKLSGILFGLDPAMALGLGGMVFGTAGWLVGPFAGEAMFRLAHRRVIAQMEVKELNFYHRIKKNRCDPSAQSVSNPVPDYYGEKIASVQGYRQWLKDQRAFRKKRETPGF